MTTARFVVTLCPGCQRMCGVNGSTCKRPASRSAADLFSDSAPGERRERGVPGRRPSEAPDGEPRPLTSRRRQVLPRAASLAAAHQVPTASRGARVAPRSTAPLRAAGLDQFPIAGAIGIPNPGG